MVQFTQRLRIVILIIINSLIFSIPLFAKLKISVVDECTKIKRSDPVPRQPFIRQPESKKITLYGAKNEIIAFQIIFTAAKKTYHQIMVSSDGLIGNVSKIPSTNIQFFRQWYLHVTEPSSVMYGEPSSEGPGWYPDPLIPFDARNGNGAPFDVARGTNQAVWVDIHIPRAADAGRYHGQLKITAKGISSETLEIDLNVWDFALPDTTHLKTFFYFGPEQLRAAHNIKRDSQAEKNLISKYMRMAHKHRINLATDAGDGIHWEDFDQNWGPYLDGTAFTDGPGKGVGCHLWPINIDIWEGQAHFQKIAKNVMEHYINKGWFRVPFLYVIDEPDEDGYENVRKVGAWLDDALHPGNLLPFMLTEHIAPQLVGYVDIWNSGRIKTANAEKRIAAGDKVWTYNGGRPGSGSQCIDHDGLAMRSWLWIAWKGNREAWHYWDCCYFDDKYNKHGETDVWSNPLTYDQRPKKYADWGNGDGTLFYPGQQWAFQHDIVDGPVSSFRMKALRRGLQDYEYLWLAKQRGHASELNELVNTVIPHPVLGDAIKGKTCYLRGQNAHSVWHEVRLQLAKLILSGK